MISPIFFTKSLITMVPLVTGAILPPVTNTCDSFKLKNLHNSEVTGSESIFGQTSVI